MKVFLAALLLTVSSATASPGLAQTAEETAEDWVLTVAPERKATVAVAQFTSGITLAARCVDDAYDLFITGLPEAPRRSTTRELALSVGEEAVGRPTVWSVGEDRTAAFSRLPAMVTRRLAEGGKVQIVATGADERRYRYVLELDPSSTALEQTLSACGRPLVDPRDEIREGEGGDGLPGTVRWQNAPRPRFPDSVGGKIPLQGYAVLSCTSEPDGRLANCQIESESPRGYNLGREALRSVGRARVRLSDDAPSDARLENRMIVFSVNFITEG